MSVEVDITKPLLAKFKMQSRVRTVEYEGIHLVCFGCGIYGHWQDACPKNQAANLHEEGLKPEGENHREGDAVPEGRRDMTVEGLRDGRVQIRKEINGISGPNESFGPWMLAKKSDRRTGKARNGKNYGRNNQGKKAEMSPGHEKKENEGNERNISSRFNVLYGLDDINCDNNLGMELDRENVGQVEV